MGFMAKIQFRVCQFIGQSLIFEDDKPYDVLHFETAEGEKVDYYFDISSFYGKW